MGLGYSKADAGGKSPRLFSDSLYPVIPAKAGIQKSGLDAVEREIGPVIPAKAGIQRGAGAGVIALLCQNQDLRDWRDLQDFAFARIALFTATVNAAKTNGGRALAGRKTLGGLIYGEVCA